jgi:hypothetical protein
MEKDGRLVRKATLHLFTSNIRPLYEQDAIDLLGMPNRCFYRFRYDAEWLNPAAEAAWQASALQGARCIVYFSLQQQAGYYAPAFIPLRYGTVEGTEVLGSARVVHFTLEDYASLRKPVMHGESYRSNVRDFTNQLAGTLLGATPEGGRSATLSEFGPPDGLFESAGQPFVFEALVDYLSQTQSFQNHLFVRVEGVREVGSATVVTPRDGQFTLVAGRNYELIVAHYQGTRSVTTTSRFQISTDSEIVALIGPDTFTISSRYDALSLQFHLPSRDDSLYSQIIIQPMDSALGPEIRVPLLVGPTKIRKFGAPVLAFLALLGVGAPSVFTQLSDPVKTVSWVGGTLLGTVLAYMGLRRT